MADKQTACIARLYGEHRANGSDYSMYPDPHPHWDSTATGFAKRAAPVIEWLTERYFIVEKSKLIEEYKSAKRDIKTAHREKAHSMLAVAYAIKALLESLFPEIAKEVE